MTFVSLKTHVKNNSRLSWLSMRVKELRLQKSLSQHQCYSDTNIHFGRIEQGKRDISFTTLCQICDYFEISPQEFFREFKGFS